MYCNHCGTQLADGTKFCSHCGLNQVEEVHKKRFNWVLVVLSILIMTTIVISSLFFLNVLSLDKMISSVFEIDMSDYVVLEKHDHVLVGENVDDYEIQIETSVLDEIEVDGEVYFIRESRYIIDEINYDYGTLALIYEEGNGDLYIVRGPSIDYNEDDDGIDYLNYSDEDLESLAETEGVILMPGKLKLNKTYEIEYDNKATEVTLIGFETIETEAGKFKNTAVLEWIYDANGEPQEREVIHYAKGIGIIKAVGYAWDEDKEKWIKEVELEYE